MKMRRGFLLLMLLLACVLTGWSQRGGSVTVTGSPLTICQGGSATLHAEAEAETTAPIIDFETGDFSQYAFVNNSSYPWTVVAATNGSSYCMRSGNSGIHNSTSAISATATFTQNGYISFSFYSSGESTDDSYDWDVSRFYIDEVLQFRYGRHDIWETYTAGVSPGTHTFKWEYKKDGSVNPTGADALFVDDIVFQDAADLQHYNFENGSLMGWKNIDADGDGNKWKVGSTSSSYYALSIPGHNNSSHCVYSESWVCTNIEYDEYNYQYTFSGNQVNPNNFLVSPSKITIHQGAYISFWACGVAQWPSEHFGVAVSTVNNPTSGSNFTTIQQWTMTSKEEEELLRGGLPSQGAWYQYTVDLSAYAGQSIWVAIRHFNCTDQFYLCVDDITIYEGSAGSSGGSDELTYQWTPGNMSGQDITVTPMQTTTYTVTAYQGDNVIGSAQQTIAVYSDPNLTITTNTDESSVCLGNEITLYANINQNYAKVGDILCTDGTRVRASDWPCGKTAKGVVFYVDATGQHGWAASLQQVSSKSWSSENAAVSGLTTYSHWMDAISDFDGYYNTQKIRDFGNAGKYPAAWAVDFNQGWYLPAIGQLNVLYGTCFSVNASLTLVGGTPIPITDGSKLWSSTTSARNDYSMSVDFYSSEIKFESKTTNNQIRPVINF